MTFMHNVLLVILFAAVIVSPFQLMQPKRILSAKPNQLWRRLVEQQSQEQNVQPVQEDKNEPQDLIQQLERASYLEPYENSIVAKRLRGEPIRFGKRSPREPIRFGKRSTDYDFQ